MVVKNDYLFLYMIEYKNWIYISIINPKRTIKKLKGIFKPLHLYFKCSRNHYPILWCPKPAYIHIVFRDVLWKDKDDIPVYENCPFYWIHLFGLNFILYWDLPKYLEGSIEEYWEQALWYLYYYDTYSQGLLEFPNINKAKESWPWRDFDTKKSTWNDKYLIQNEIY